MVDKDILLEKVAIIQRCLKRILDVTGLSVKTLDQIENYENRLLDVSKLINQNIYCMKKINTNQNWITDYINKNLIA